MNTDDSDTAGETPVTCAPTGQELVDELAASGKLDELFASIDAGGVQLTGKGGVVPALIRAALERGLQAELTDHLGFEKGAPEGRGAPNIRNGTTHKTVASEVGDIDLDVPRDREGTNTARLVPKRSRRLGGLDDMIISLYAGGMTIREIQHHLAATIGTELSPETISNITDAVMEEVKKWQARPLEAFYPVMYLDAIVVKIKDAGKVANRAAHIAIGVDMEGIKHVLGIWVQAKEGASFWAGVCADLANRGVKDVLIVVGAPPAVAQRAGETDGLSGFPEAIEATWPQAIVQTCVVHLLRASMRFVNYKDRKAVAAALKPIYTAPGEDVALEALQAFTEGPWGVKYPTTVAAWERAWEKFTPFLAFPPELRRVIYTTNAIESFNYQMRKITKNRGHFPSDDAAIKLLWLGIMNIEDKTARARQKEMGKPRNLRRPVPATMMEGRATTNWKQALAQLAVAYPDRINPYL